jgi:hypothetical protein
MYDDIRRVIFVAGLLPPEGESPLSQRPFVERLLASIFNAKEKGFWLPNPFFRYKLGLEQNTLDGETVLSRLSPDPAAPWTMPTWYGQFPGRMPITYVLLSRDRFMAPRAQQQCAALMPNVVVRELDTGHECPLTHPEELASLLLQYA